MNVPILIVGESGSGKTTMLRTLDPATTMILNTEQKPLPFKNLKHFKNRQVKSYKEFESMIRAIEAGKASNIKTLILDSITSLAEMIDSYCENMFTNYEKWKQYNLMVVKTIKRLKVLDIQVIVIGIPENKEESFGDIKQYLRIRGKELKYGFIEKEFMIVLFTKQMYDEDGEMEDVKMFHRPNKFNTAKAPEGMFPKEISNDAKDIISKIGEYYAEEVKPQRKKRVIKRNAEANVPKPEGSLPNKRENTAIRK